ncbi:MAG: redoxin [Betaproteobacteria bacterium HGW-Betaproteobacteria-8]|nr:MAG: redoxin [Betaproteobacteria bacterium HGW-Betaproteobacteria-8]
MLKRPLLYLIAIAAIVIFAFALRHFVLSPLEPSGTIATHAFFAAEFPGLDGEPQAMAQWKGKIVIVNFWATWCPPCLEEMPELSRLHTEYQDKGVVVLGISSDELEKIREFAQQTPVSYPLLSGDVDAMNVSESLGNNMGVLPYTAIISADGSIVKTYFGRVNQALLEETILPLLQAQN